MLHAFPFASVPLKFDCAVWVHDDSHPLVQRVGVRPIRMGFSY